jgi:hypothetical protein
VESQNTGSIGLAVLFAFPISALPLRRVSLRFGLAASVALAVASVSPWMTVVVYRTLSVVGKQLPGSVEEPALSRLLPYTVVEARASDIATDYFHIWTAAANPSTGFALGATWLDANAYNDIGLFLAQARLIDEALMVAHARGIAPPSSHVITVGDVDYMGYLLHATPVKGIALWHNTRTFRAPSLEQMRHYLRQVEVAFEPRCGLSIGDLYIVNAFMPALQIDFRREQLTECWHVWLRAQ